MRLAVDPSTDRGDYPFSHAIRTRFAETDAMGIVHHAAYLPYLEEARVAYLRALGRPYAALREEGIDFSVIEVFVQYRRPLRFDEVVDVAVDVASVTAATMQLAYLLTVSPDRDVDGDEPPGEVRATAVTVHGCVRSDGRPTRLPAWVRELAGSSPS